MVSEIRFLAALIAIWRFMLAATAHFHSRLRVAATAILLAGCALSCLAATFHANPEDYLDTLKRLRPGDTLLLAAGEYRDGLPLHGMSGIAGKPIVISGPADKASAVFLARPGANTVSILNSKYLTVRHLVLDGQGLPVDAVKAEGRSAWAHHITLEGLRIENYNADQQVIGISTKCPAWGWIIRGNTIIGSGTGMYLGDSDGSAPFVAGLIEDNIILDSTGYNLQIKHQKGRPEIAGMPQGKSLTVIRHNVFSKSVTNSSTGKLARPNVLVGHWPLTGPGLEDTYAIYGNFFYENPSEALFQGEGNIALYSNVFINSYGDAINIQPHNAAPRRIAVFFNTIVAARGGVRVVGGDPAYRQRLVGNLVFAAEPLVGGEHPMNTTGFREEAAGYLARPFDRLKIDVVDAHLPSLLPDVSRDFEGRLRARKLPGAYSAQASWPLQLGPKRMRGR
jgi:hypothetical protein